MSETWFDIADDSPVPHIYVWASRVDVVSGASEWHCTLYMAATSN